MRNPQLFIRSSVAPFDGSTHLQLKRSSPVSTCDSAAAIARACPAGFMGRFCGDLPADSTGALAVKRNLRAAAVPQFGHNKQHTTNSQTSSIHTCTPPCHVHTYSRNQSTAETKISALAQINRQSARRHAEIRLNTPGSLHMRRQHTAHTVRAD